MLNESPGVAYNNESPGVVPEVANEEPTSITGVENEVTPIDELFEPFDNTAGVDGYHSTTRLDDFHPTPIDEHNPTDTSAPMQECEDNLESEFRKNQPTLLASEEISYYCVESTSCLAPQCTSHSFPR